MAFKQIMVTVDYAGDSTIVFTVWTLSQNWSYNTKLNKEESAGKRSVRRGHVINVALLPAKQ